MKKVTIYTDGAARGNPDGPGGYGTVMLYEDANGVIHRKELSGGYAKTTNNRMELMAAIAGLEELKFPCEVDLYTDSRYLSNAFNEGWLDSWIKKGWKKSDGKPVLNPDLWQRLLDASKGHIIHWIWVKGHNGNPENERCDTLATEAADSMRESS